MPKYAKTRFNKKGKLTVAKLASKINRIAHANTPEHKAIDCQINGAIVYAGSSDYVSGCAQGTTASTRVGLKTTLKSMELKYRITKGSAQTADTEVRVIALIDKECNGAAPPISDVLELTGSTNAVLSPYKLSNAGRFKILHDSGAIPHLLLGPQTICRRKYVSLNHKATYAGVGGTITDALNNQIFIMSISSLNGGGGTAQPYVSAYTRVRYTDE